MSKTYLIYGVSKGLGKALVEGIPTNKELVYGVSRSNPRLSKVILLGSPLT
ncbi:hypothetical protein [Providencia huaxiensis]|uniref:hypothetical protein n=1 Tax=Providencia huaxiensis TaxID=2027290 RepID=UPI0034DD6500